MISRRRCLKIYRNAKLISKKKVHPELNIYLGKNVKINLLKQDYIPDDKGFYIKIGSNTIIRDGNQFYGSSNIGSKSIIGERCIIGKNANIGRNVKIGDNVSINTRVIIGNSCVIENNIKIGFEVTIEDNVHLTHSVTVEGVILTSGSEILDIGGGIAYFDQYRQAAIVEGLPKAFGDEIADKIKKHFDTETVVFV